MATTKEELKAMVADICDELEAAADGDLYKDENGDAVIIKDIDEWKAERYKEKIEEFKKEHPEDAGFDKELYETYDEFMEDEIGTVDDIDDPEEVSVEDYVNDNSLGDVRFEVDSDLELIGGKVLFAYGGPNIWVADDEVRGYWGCDEVTEPLWNNARTAMFNMFDRLWEYKKESRGL
jgi:hypothetical protein